MKGGEDVASDQGEIHTVDHIAQRLDVSPGTVYGEIHLGRLAAIKVGRLWRVTEKSLQDYLRRSDGASEATTQEGNNE